MQAEDRAPGQVTLLVVEDDPEMRALLYDFLQREGVRIRAEASGERAIAAAEAERVDVVVLDKEMPGMNGLDLLTFFRHRFPDVPVILITAFGGSRVAEEAFRRGAARYLEKPFRVSDLLGAIRTVIEDGHRREAAQETR
jgi:DNA-binding NtrC family response regulator